MRIGNDRASIALVTLENNEDSNESKGGPRRALARLYDSKAVFGSRADSRPKPDALRKPARGRARYGASQSEIKRCRKDTLAAMIAFGWRSGRSARILRAYSFWDRSGPLGTGGALRAYPKLLLTRSHHLLTRSNHLLTRSNHARRTATAAAATAAAAAASDSPTARQRATVLHVQHERLNVNMAQGGVREPPTPLTGTSARSRSERSRSARSKVSDKRARSSSSDSSAERQSHDPSRDAVTHVPT